MATGTEAEGLTVTTTGPGVAVVVVTEVLNAKVLIILIKDCDPATGECSQLSSSSLMI